MVYPTKSYPFSFLYSLINPNYGRICHASLTKPFLNTRATVFNEFTNSLRYNSARLIMARLIVAELWPPIFATVHGERASTLIDSDTSINDSSQ